jgi:hypothetical protein
MFTHIHTTEWVYNPDCSNDDNSYFVNRVDGRILLENKRKKGYEYYLCSDIQMKKGLTGIYVGCVERYKDGEYPDVMVFDHNTQPERTVSLNDEEYL